MQERYVMSDFVLKTANLSYAYPGGSTLTFKDLQLKKQEHTLVLGDSGSGKSTLLNLIGGFSYPHTGQVEVNNQVLDELSGTALDRYRAQNLGFIFQEAHLLRNLTISENIQLAQSLAGLAVDQPSINDILRKLQLNNFSSRRPNQLSRGQIQRAAVARALINKPTLLIADEPTASLDDKNTFLVIDLLKELADQQGSTLLISTHDKRLKDQFNNSYILEA